MCGHGTMGLLTTLEHLGRIAPGRHRVDTPVGTVEAELLGDGRVTVRNVASYRHAAGVELDVPGLGRVVGDVAWGGNWFFLVHGARADLDLAHVDALTAEAQAIRAALHAAGVTGADGATIDHVEFNGPSATADARGFVLCPGGAYDRSPCGTGTSAHVACLHADGRLAPGRPWRQESVVGSAFEAWIERVDGAGVHVRLRGQAYVTGAATLRFDPRDPFRFGLR
jgi:proline racemase